MPYIADNESLYRSYVQCINQNRWRDLPDVLTFPINFNGDMIATPQALKEKGTAKGWIKLRTDAFTVDNENGRLAATSVAELQPRGGPKIYCFMKQTIVWIRDRKIFKIATTGAPERLVERKDPMDSPSEFKPDLISTYSNGHYKAGREHLPAQELEKQYRGYIECINERTMQSKLPTYCHDRVIHNARPLSLGQYRLLLEQTVAVMPDVKVVIETIVVDPATQRVAVRLEFTGTPAAGWPVKPTVRYHEYATYFFQGGKIDRVWSIIDTDSYRRQLPRAGSSKA